MRPGKVMVLSDILRLEALKADMVAMGVDSDAFWFWCSSHWDDILLAQDGVQDDKDHGGLRSFDGDGISINDGFWSIMACSIGVFGTRKRYPVCIHRWVGLNGEH